jgi:hypothetical protein
MRHIYKKIGRNSRSLAYLVQELNVAGSRTVLLQAKESTKFMLNIARGHRVGKKILSVETMPFPYYAAELLHVQ